VHLAVNWQPVGEVHRPLAAWLASVRPTCVGLPVKICLPLERLELEAMGEQAAVGVGVDGLEAVGRIALVHVGVHRMSPPTPRMLPFFRVSVKARVR
jgi:hypothetical protein